MCDLGLTTNNESTTTESSPKKRRMRGICSRTDEGGPERQFILFFALSIIPRRQMLVSHVANPEDVISTRDCGNMIASR